MYKLALAILLIWSFSESLAYRSRRPVLPYQSYFTPRRQNYRQPPPHKSPSIYAKKRSTRDYKAQWNNKFNSPNFVRTNPRSNSIFSNPNYFNKNSHYNNNNNNNNYKGNNKPYYVESVRINNYDQNVPNVGQSRPNFNNNNFNFFNFNQPQNNAPKKCGVIKPIIRNYVANGRTTRHVEWPWYVQIIIYTDAEAYCGGTLISENYILTAAHCFDDMPQSELSSSTTVLLKGVRLMNKRTNDYDDIEIKASKVYIHPDYVPAMTLSDARRMGIEPGPRNDLALIKINIRDPEVLNEITPACLPENGYQIPINAKCKIMGHGFVNAYDEDRFIMPRMLQMADIFISDNEVCKAEVDSEAIKSKINQDTLCIRGPIHPCVGDSGGPLICKGHAPNSILGDKDDEYDYGVGIYDRDENDDTEWYLAGVTSFAVSTDLNDKCGLFKSAVFGKVANYLPWIKSLTNL